MREQSGTSGPEDTGHRLRLLGRERQFEEAQALAHVGSWEWDLAGDRSVWSDEMCRIFGQPVGCSPTWAQFEAMVHPDDRVRIVRQVNGARDGERTASSYRIVRPSGEVRHVHGRRYGRADADGVVTHLFGTLQDITDQRAAELASREARELFETAFSQAPIGMALIGLDGRWMKVNQAICRITGWTETELLSRTFQDITHPDDLDADLAQVQLLLSGRINGYQMEKRYLTRWGAEIWVLLSVSLVRHPSGEPRHFVSQIEDISERKLAQRRLQEAEAEARVQRDHATAIIGAMSEGYALTMDSEIKAVNGAMSVLTGFTRDQLIGSRPPFPFWPPESEEELEDTRRDLLQRGGGTFEVTLMRASGERFEAEITAMPARDPDGRSIGFVNTLRDVSIQNRQQRELERLARTDSLTGLANRHVLQDSLARYARVETGSRLPLALILLDLDLFKQVNDDFGHPAGDDVLVEVGHRLARIVESDQVLARMGGEEFAWLLPASSVAEAVAAADRARAEIASRRFGAAGTLTLSAGVGLISSLTDPDALYRLADSALYQAKQLGRNRTCCRTRELDAPVDLALVPDPAGEPPPDQGSADLDLDAIA
jgi:diguanylate cyclase (GGDEF)-like protein/PAS domain S-box-containing protein